MPRRPRVFVPGAIYHVYCRTSRRDPVLADPDEASRFVDLVREVKLRDRFAVLAWCLMPNHYHLVVRTAEVPLWRSMRLIQGRFAQGHNRRHGSLGSVWQERYKAKTVTEQQYLGQLLAYVHLNPVVAGLAKTPAAWRWSGHRELTDPGAHGLVDAQEVWMLLGETAGEARQVYCGWLETALGQRLPEEPMGRVPWWLREASGDASLVPSAPRPRLDAQGVSTGLVRPPLEAAEYLELATRAEGVSLVELASARRDRASVRAREAVILVGVERYCLRSRDLAEALGRSADQVSRWAGQGSRRKATDVDFRQRLDRIDRAVAAKDA